MGWLGTAAGIVSAGVAVEVAPAPNKKGALVTLPAFLPSLSEVTVPNEKREDVGADGVAVESLDAVVVVDVDVLAAGVDGAPKLNNDVDDAALVVLGALNDKELVLGAGVVEAGLSSGLVVVVVEEGAAEVEDKLKLRVGVEVVAAFMVSAGFPNEEAAGVDVTIAGVDPNENPFVGAGVDVFSAVVVVEFAVVVEGVMVEIPNPNEGVAVEVAGFGAGVPNVKAEEGVVAGTELVPVVAIEPKLNPVVEALAGALIVSVLVAAAVVDEVVVAGVLNEITLGVGVLVPTAVGAPSETPLGTLEMLGVILAGVLNDMLDD